MTLNIIDISSYQGTSANNIAGADGVIVKVSQGTGYINPYCDLQYQAAKASGRVLGIYHYLSGGDAVGEARFFMQHSEGYWKNDHVTIWADWESGDNSAWGNGQYVVDFINEVNRIAGIDCCGLYTGVEGIAQTGGTLASTTALWFAGYPDLRDSWDAPDFMWSIAPWSTMTMWQFTDSQGMLDRSIFYGDRDTWGKLSVKGDGNLPNPTPQPSPTPSVSYSTQGKSLEIIAGDAQNGLAGNHDVRRMLLGGLYDGVQTIVNERAGVITADESHKQLADQGLSGSYGDGDTRIFLLGSYYETVQNIINGGSAGADSIYIVQPGDTLSDIAGAYDVSVQSIMDKNGIANPNLIQIGQTLKF